MPLGYRAVRRLAQLLISLFYRRVEVAGVERVPARGPLVVVANHHNALVDPMLLVATFPRRLLPIAKAPLFRHPLIGPFLRLAGALAARRRQDEEPGREADPARNQAMFEAAGAALADGRGVLIFPEGVSQPEPALMPLRTGAARMILDAERRNRATPVTVLPVGLVFHAPGTFRAGWALVLIGRPLDTAGHVMRAAAAPETAVRELTGDIAAALRALIVEARDRETQQLLELAERIWRDDTGDRQAGAASRAAWRRRVIRAYRHLSEREPERVARFRSELARYARTLELTGLSGREPAAGYPLSTVLRYALREGPALALGLPLALFGILIHIVPYRLAALALRALRPGPDAEATYKIAAGVVLFPLCWLAEAWLAWRLGGGGLAAALLAGLAPAGFFAIGWRTRLARVRSDARGFVEFLLDRNLYRNLLARRRALAEEMQALAALVPDTLLDDGARP